MQGKLEGQDGGMNQVREGEKEHRKGYVMKTLSGRRAELALQIFQ